MSFAWSYSALSLYKTCPRKYWAEKVAKVVPFKSNDAAEYGKMVHKKFENYLMKGSPLPLDLKHHEKVLKKLRDASGEGMPEQKLALTEDLEPTGYFDKDVWFRCVIDYAKVNDGRALVVDHKTGRRYDDFLQLELSAIALHTYLPDVEQFTLAYYWTKDKKITPQPLTTAEFPRVWAKVHPVLDRIENSYATDSWPLKQNFLCEKYCGYKDCPYNGK